MSFLDDLKAHAEAVKAWLEAFEQHLMHGTPAAPPVPPIPPTAVVTTPVPTTTPAAPPVAVEPPDPADNSADALNAAEVKANQPS